MEPLMQEEILTATRYYWGCCMVCKRAGSEDEPLKRCARCSCMFYCSKEHQKLDWKLHKRLCSYLATAAEEVGADNFFGHQIGKYYIVVRKFCPLTRLLIFNLIEFDEDEDDLKDGEEKEILEESPNEKSKSWKSWTKFRINAVKMCEILIGIRYGMRYFVLPTYRP